MAFSLRTLAHSEIGPVRQNNQDSGYVSPRLLVVADGMGGAAAGDLASAVAIRALAKVDEHYEGSQMLEALAGAISRANDDIADLVAWNHELDGMGTTVCAALFSGDQLGLAHIGDSRAYLLREGRLQRLTTDHSWVQSLVDEGKLSPEDAAHHPYRSLLLRVLNGQPSHEPDLSLVDLEAGDRLLFCSDGLCGLVADEQIRKLLARDELSAALRGLVQAAHAKGGSDNITVVIADVVDQDAGLEALPGRRIGAAEVVDIPEVPDADPGSAEGHEPTRILDAEGNPLSRVALPAGLAEADGNSLELPVGVIDPDARERLRYAPTVPRSRRPWLVLVIVAVVVIILAVVGTLGGRAYIASQYYIGALGDSPTETVAIFQGLPDEVAGLHFSTLAEDSAVPLGDLPPYYAQVVRARQIRTDSLAAARATVSELAVRAANCRQQREQAGPPEGTAAPQSPGPTVSTEAPQTAEPGSTSGPASALLPTPPSASPGVDPEACS